MSIFTSWSRVESKPEVTDYMTKVLLKYLAHPISSIRKEAYQTILAVLKVYNKSTFELDGLAALIPCCGRHVCHR